MSQASCLDRRCHGPAAEPFGARCGQDDPHRLGHCSEQAASLTPYVDALRLGYVEGRNLAIEFRYGDDMIERVPGLATELVRLPVDLVVAQGAAAFEVPSHAHRRTPIATMRAGRLFQTRRVTRDQRQMRRYGASASSKILASFKSSVPKPSVNQP